MIDESVIYKWIESEIKEWEEINETDGCTDTITIIECLELFRDTYIPNHICSEFPIIQTTFSIDGNTYGVVRL